MKELKFSQSSERHLDVAEPFGRNEGVGLFLNLGLANCLFVPCPRYLPSHRYAELPQRGSLRTAEKNLSGKGILLVLYERLSLWESSREAGEIGRAHV